VDDASNELHTLALRSLQRAIASQEESVSAEAIAAATLLQMHETALGNPGRASSHANGSIKMLQLRGPSNFDSELERTILRAQIGNIFMMSMQKRTPCFLAEPAWYPLLWPNNGEEVPLTSSFAAMSRFGVHMPGVLCFYEDFRTNYTNVCNSDGSMSYSEKTHQITHDFDVTGLLRQVAYVYQQMTVWREQTLKLDYRSSYGTLSEVQAARILHASTLAYYVFALCIEYMAVDIAYSTGGYAITTELLDFVILEDDPSMPILERFQHLVLKSKSEFRALKSCDDMTASNTLAFMRTFLLRVLESSGDADVQVGLLTLRETMHDLLGFMEQQLELLKDYPHSSFRPTISKESSHNVFSFSGS
jgi:hypothetical protein